jgi:outer membrane phospholipase A
MRTLTASAALASTLFCIGAGCAPPPPPRQGQRVTERPITPPPDTATTIATAPASAPAAAPSTAPTTAPASPTAAADSTAPPVGSASAARAAGERPPRAHLGSFPSLLPHRPIYVLVGPDTPNVKFQFSTKVPLLAPGSAEDDDPFFSSLSNLYLAYSQMSLWDITEPGKATIDTTYMPEAFYALRTPPFEARRLGATALAFQVGVQHESNGRSGEASRNVNYVYFQPTIYFGDPEHVHAEFGPKAKVYFGPQADNPDIEDFAGYVDLFAALRFDDDLHVTWFGRIGGDPGKGAFQFDITYPLIKYRIDAYLQLQYFNGYGESLLGYKHHDQEVRLGVGFVR